MARRSVESIHKLTVKTEAIRLSFDGDKLDMIRNAYRNGWDDATVAGMLDITRTSWLRVLRRNETLREIVDEAREHANGTIAQTVHALARRADDPKFARAAIAACIWWQKNKAGWKDKQEHIVTPPTGPRPEYVCILADGRIAFAPAVRLPAGPRSGYEA
jgi:hypothetical protein